MQLAQHSRPFLPGLAHTLSAATLGWVAGSALQLQQPELYPSLVYVVFVALALVIYAYAASKNVASLWRSGAAAVAMAALAFGATGLRSAYFLQHALDPALEGRDVQVVGVVADMPQPNEAGLRFRLEVESAQLDGVVLQLPARVDVAWYGGVYPTGSELVGLQRQPLDLRAGERWSMTLRLKAPHGSQNPHGFDYELWLWEQGVGATGYVRAGARDTPPQRIAHTWRHPVALERQVLRERIVSSVQQRQTAGLIAALVVGDQNAIDRTDWDVFRATGVAHLMSISGLHITMFAWGASMLVGWLWRRSSRLCLALPVPTAALWGGVLLATGYAVFSGWGVPAQRTCVMLATVSLLRLAGARWPWPQVWLLACAVVVAVDPWALLQPGFWLSFVAVGVLFATDSGANRAGSAGARATILSNLREQWVITVALAPLTLLLFGQVSLVGLVANALAIPWVTLVVTPLAMLGTLVPGLWEVAAWAVGWLLVWLQWLAGFPWATVSMAAMPQWAGVAGVLGALLLVMPLPWSMRSLGVPLLLPVLLWRPLLPAPGDFALMAADVGQGNAVLVQTAGHALLYDAGPRYSLESDAGHRVLVPLLKALGTRLDRVVLSHRDTDHVGGAAAVLAMQPQADLWSSLEATHPLQALRAGQRCEAGQQWEWDGVQFAVLHPGAEDYTGSAKPNALSCVLRISNGRQTALLVGDIEQAQELALLERARIAAGPPQGDTAPSGGSEPHAVGSVGATILLVPHHGSKTSSSGAFLDAVQPQLAWVQAGYRNRFGHPVASVLERYRERNIAVTDSPHCGAMEWSSQAPAQVQCARLARQRYWHHRVP